MGIFDGHVLRGPRVAQSNATTTAPSTGGVCGDVKVIGTGFTASFQNAWGTDNLVRPSYYQYEAAILEGREGKVEEYLVWAANSSNLSVVEGPTNAIDEGSVSIPWGEQYVFTSDMSKFSKPLAGEVTFTSGLAAITGVGTEFESALSPGAYIYFGLAQYTVASVESDTEATLTAPAGASFVAAAGTIVVIEPLAGASENLVLTDDGGRSIAGVIGITVVLGDDELKVRQPLVVGVDITCDDPDSGIITINDTPAMQAMFRPAAGSVPAMSSKRGDFVYSVAYYLAAPRFWWTRNDPGAERFGWNGAKQRWEPFKGGPPKDLERLTPDGSYELSPRPTGIAIGEYLPGTYGADEYCMVRLGLRPDSSSIPVGDAGDGEAFRGVLAVPDDVAESGDFDFASYVPPPAAIVGETSGTLIWNPQMIALHAGKTVWYMPLAFEPASNGALGELDGSDSDPLFITPIPGPTERPLLRIGSRRWLNILFLDTDAELMAEANADPDWPPTGNIALSLSTGMIKCSPADVVKASMGLVESPNPDFDKAYGGVQVFYDGVSLTRAAQPPRAPVQLAASLDAGDLPLSIPTAEVGPGLGTSGIWHVEDGTGAVPDGTPQVTHRYGESGLVRKVEGIGDSFVFVPNRPLEKLKLYNTIADLAQFVLMPFLIRKGRAAVAVGNSATGTQAVVGLTDLVRFNGRSVYFQQADLTPAVYAEDARIVSRRIGPYTLRGDERLYMVFSGSTITQWDAIDLAGGEVDEDGVEYTTEEVAEAITLALPAGFLCSAVMNRLVIHPDQAPPYTGQMEILPGLAGNKDLSGCAALGILPFWAVNHPVDPAIARTATDPNWLPDSGSSVGLWRSPYNEDGSGDEPDFAARARMDEEHLGDVSESPFVFLMQTPLEDVAGVDDGVFFEIQRGPYRKKLEHLDNIKHMFEDGKFAWIDSKTVAFAAEAPVSNVPLGGLDVVPETLHPALKGYFRSSLAGEPFALMQEDEDYIVPHNGMPGSAILTETIGELLFFGAKGSFSAGGTVLTDDSAEFVTNGVLEGYRLKIPTGDAAGSYRVTAVQSDQLDVEPSFPAGSGASPVAWEVYKMKTVDEIDSQVVVDYVYNRFNHLPEEPFIIRVLTKAGACPLDEAAQTAGRLSVDLAKDLQRSRPVFIRFGLEGVNLSVTLLERSELGRIANSSVFIPPGPSFDDRTFKLVIGTTELVAGVDLLEVAEFSEDPGTGDGAEFLPGTGEVRFGSNLLESLEQSEVVFSETFTNPSTLLAGSVEVDPGSGGINLSAPDMVSYGTEDVYWVARMITEDRLDVVPNPMAGAFLFREPLIVGQLVEVTYTQCDSGGDKLIDEEGVPNPPVTEFLPLYVRGEECARIEPQIYSFNPEGKTTRQDVEPVVYAGHEMMNFAGLESMQVDWDENRIYFSNEVGEAVRVTISYGVFEAFGGELVYTVSKPPVYRPPFYIPGGSDSFTLVSDRTDDLLPGAVLRLGGHMFYLKSVVYDAASDTTAVSIFPSTERDGAGSLAPGNDAISFVTVAPVTSEVDGTPTPGAPGGFMVGMAELLGLVEDPVWEPVTKGRVEVVIAADLTKVVTAGHLLEMSGVPYTIVAVNLSDDGRRTTVSTTPNFTKGAAYGIDTIRLTTRPLYPQGNVNYIGAGPYLYDLPNEVVLWGEEDELGNELPGRTLAQGVDYNADPITGEIAVQVPKQQHVAPGQMLAFSRTRVIVAQPSLKDGVLMFPRFGAKYKHGHLPSDDNGLKSAALLGTYTFRSPDSFYFRAVPLLDYMGEVALQMVQEAKAKGSSYGPSTGGGGGPKNWDNGRVGLAVERTGLLDKDRAARKFLGFYNQVVVCCEQINETITGRIVGDRDRKFRFWVGAGLEWTPPGWEDPVTGLLNPRNLWTTVFMEFSGSTQGTMRVDEDDWVVVPYTAGIVDGVIDGEFIDGDVMRYLIARQAELIKNDVDDFVIVRRKRPRIIFKLLPLPHFVLKARGRYERLSEPNEFSRIFPERSRAFTNLFPGVGNNPPAQNYGEHLFLGMRDWKLKSTFFSSTAAISNPVLGTIENIFSISSSPRTARARIWDWSPTGFPDLDAALGTDFTNNPRPAVIATPFPLTDFPVDSDTGLPDVSRMASMDENGIPDLNTGDWEISTPPWRPGTKVQFGRPDGTIYSVGHTATSLSIFGMSKVNPVFVEAIYGGCVVVFNDSDGDSVVSHSSFVELTSDDGGPPVDIFKGDTIMESLGAGAEVEPEDPPTMEDLTRVAASMPAYRNGFDVAYNRRRGQMRDISFPSFGDPTFFGLQEIFGQNPPKPNTRIESEVFFHQSELEPVEIPALLGDFRDDSGDFTLPYLAATNTEIQRLQAAARGGVEVIMSDCDVVPAIAVWWGQTWKAVFPDEILGADGVISSSGVAPAALTTSVDLFPVDTNGSYDARSGVGDLRRWDLLLVEGDDIAPVSPVAGSQGILSVGQVDPSSPGVIETPRFIAPVNEGSRVNYKVDRAIVWTDHDGGYTSGLRVEQRFYDETPAGFRWTETRFKFDSVGPGFIILDDGSQGGLYDPVNAFTPTGGLNDLFAKAMGGAGTAADPATILKLKILRRPADLAAPVAGDGEVQLEVWIRKSSVYAAGEEIKDGEFYLSVDEGVTWTQAFVYAADTDSDGTFETDYDGPVVWFHTDSGSATDDIIIRTVHPDDEHLDATDGNGTPEGTGGYDPGTWGYQDPLYDPANTDDIAEWFPFVGFDHVTIDGDGDLPELQPGEPGFPGPNPDYDEETKILYTYGGHLPGDPDLYLDSFIDLEVVEGRTAIIENDRLTFSDRVDFRTARPRDFEHTLTSNTPLWLVLKEIRSETVMWNAVGTATSVMSSVNDPETSMNVPDPLTFLARAIGAGTVYGVGWYDTVGVGIGSVKAMAWEGHGNTPVEATTVLFSAVPSSSVAKDASLDICEGTGIFGGAVDTPASPPGIDTAVLKDRILVHDTGNPAPQAASFDPTTVEKGDIAVVWAGAPSTIDTLMLNRGTARAGTYLIRHTITADPYQPAAPDQTVPTESMVKALHLTAPTPSPSGWVRSYMPKITAVDRTLGRIWVDAVEPVTESPTGHAWTATGDFYILRSTPATGVDEATWRGVCFKIPYTAVEDDDSDVDYAGTGWFSVTIGGLLDSMDDTIVGAAGPLTDDQRWDLLEAEVGKTVFGIKYLPVRITGQGLPPTGATGYTEGVDATSYVAHLGFAALTVRHPHLEYDDGSDGSYDNGTVEFNVDKTLWDGTLEGSLPASFIAISEAPVPANPGAYQVEEGDYQHTGIPYMLDISDVSDADWQTINTAWDDDALAPAAHTSVINALMPGCSLETATTPDVLDPATTFPAFYAEAGLFLEPSFPRPVSDLADGNAQVVAGPDFNSAALDLPADAVGSRAELDFLDVDEIAVLTAAVPGNLFERVQVSVRRIRRWHEVQDQFALNLAALRYAYETRYGTINTYAQAGTFGTFVADGDGTQLGGFDDADVNINPGDIVRVYGETTGELIAQGEIASIQNATTLQLAPPGLIIYDEPDGTTNPATPWVGLRFEVYLHLAPVPHQQSNDQLLELATDRVILKREAVMDDGAAGQDGGMVAWDTSEAGPMPGTQPELDVWKSTVYDASVNILTDTEAGTDPDQINFQQLGVEEDDIILIDPAGPLRPPGIDPVTPDEELEQGSRPYGDIGVDGRSTDWIKGRPAELDDNRGYYVVEEVSGPTELKLKTFDDSPFAGMRGGDRLFSGGDTAFALYPTVNASGLTGQADPAIPSTEGQGDLRPTAFVGEDLLAVDGVGNTEPTSYADNFFSIAPFSYRILRPSGFFSEEALELILFHRERILSLIEHFKRAMDGSKRGTYREFQELRHIDDLGSPTVDEEGMGLLSNAFIYGVTGQFQTSPFLNDADCLSVLDRRVHCQDYELDLTKPPFDAGGDFYTAMKDLGVGRPLVVDMFDNILNNSDRFRELRYSWLTYRVHRVDGTLPKVERFDRELPKRIRELERMRRMTEGTGR